MPSAVKRVRRQLVGPAMRRLLAATGRDVAELRGTAVRLRVDPTTSFGRELLEHGERQSERFLIPLMQKLLSPGDVFLDVGAHWGTYSVVASELVGEGGRVLAVEPHLPSLRRIRANLELNGCTNVTTVGCAVGPSEARGALRVRGSADNLNRLTGDGDVRV